MKHEIITLNDVKVIGVAKDIEFKKGNEECPKFWGEYFQTLIKPVLDGNSPNAQQKAAMENNIGQYGVCTCNLPKRNCWKCAEEHLGKCVSTFRYVIAGTYKGGDVPEGMELVDLPNGEWLKFHFVGGMKAFQQQYQEIFNKWIPEHPEMKLEPDMSVEWYEGMDINDPEYKCGVMVHIG